VKIVIINEHPMDALGGSEVQCDIIARELYKLGHQVVYLACNGTNNYNTAYRVKPVRLNGKEIGEAVIDEKPDIVYWRNNKHSAFRTSVRIIRELGIPVVFAVSHISDTIKWKKFRIKPNGSVLKQFITGPLQILRSIRNHDGFKYVSGIVVNNQDHLGRLDIEPEIYIPNSNTSDKINFKWKKPYICWIANLKSRKRPELCLEVAKRLGNNYDVLIAGKIQDSNYDWIINSDKVQENLKYLGPKSVLEVNGIIASSICLIHTCTPEGFPGNFIQAWLQSKPVVSYDVDPGGITESEKLGFVSGHNMDRFMADIQKLIDNPGLNKEIGKRAKSYADKHFHSVINVRKLEKFLFEVMEAQRHQ
jgi:glycosyltransferase involved in cell wall biosynthesis